MPRESGRNKAMPAFVEFDIDRGSRTITHDAMVIGSDFSASHLAMCSSGANSGNQRYNDPKAACDALTERIAHSVASRSVQILTGMRKARQPLRSGLWIHSRGGTRTLDPGIMSAVL